MKKVFSIAATLCFTIVLHGQVSKTLNVTAGGLKTALTAIELSTVTNLTLTGFIDARDFKTMRDDMPELAQLDLSSTTVASYTGAEGPYYQYSYDHPANEIPDYSFLDPNTYTGKTKLKTVVLPSSVTSIGISAFEYCTGLQNITMPSALTNIGSTAFAECSSLISVNIPSPVKTIGQMAFLTSSGLINVASENTRYSSLDGILFDKLKTRLISCPTSKTGSFIIPPTVTIIEYLAFKSCKDITTITIPSSVNSLVYGAFQDCSSLTSLILPSSITTFGGSAFEGCSNLKTIYSFAITPAVFNDPGIFDGVDKLTCKLYVPKGSSSLYSAASQWQDFTNILEMQEFKLSTNYLTIAASGGVAHIDLTTGLSWSAGSDNSWLTVSPNAGVGNHSLSLTSSANINVGSRTGMVTISSADMPSLTIALKQEGATKTVNVTAGGLSATLSAEELINVYSLVLTGFIDARDFKTMRDDMPGLKNVDLSNTNILSYSGTEGTRTGYIDYPANATPENALAAQMSVINTSLSSVILPSSISAIGMASFVGCEDLASINIPTSVTSIGYGAFYGCSGLTSITIPSSVTTIEYGAFILCTKLITITIPSSITSIGDNAFMGSGGIINVALDNPIYSSIDGILFNKTKTTLIHYPISKVGNYIIPSSVTTIGRSAFYNCTSLTSITIPSSVTSLMGGTFYGCSSLTSVIIPSSVTSLEAWEFSNCLKLTSVTIPSSVTTIGDYAFYNCTDLNSIITYSTTPVDLNASTSIFSGIDQSICKLYIPFGSYGLYSAAGLWKDFLNIIEMPGFALSAKSVTIAAPEGSNATIELTSNTTWATSSNQAWLSVSPSSGNGAGTLTFTAGLNPSTTSRTATVTVSDPEVESQTITINQNGNDISTVIEETENSTIKIYPNPAKDYLTINIDNYSEMPAYTIKITNQQGIVVFQTKLTQPQYEINTTNWSGKGIYVLQVYDSNKIIKSRKKIIVQ